MTLNTGLFNLCQRVAPRNGGVTLRAFYANSHHIGLRFFLLKGFSSDELHLRFVTIDAFRFRLVMTAQAFHSRFTDLSMFLPCRMACVAIQYSCNMFPVWKWEVVDLDFRILKPLVALTTLRMRDLDGFGQRNRLFGMASCARGLFPTMAFKAGLFGGTKSGWIMRVVIDIVMTGGTGIFQLFDMKTVWDRNIIRIQIGRSPLNIKNVGVTTDAVWIDLVQFGREAGMFPPTLERKDVDARHQGMACCMTLRTADLGMQG
jgi:hypothetical protein